MAGLIGRVRDRVRLIVVARWQILRLTPRAGWGLVSGTVALNAVLGVLPVVFLISTSVLVGKIPSAFALGVGSSAWDELVTLLLLAGAAIAANLVLAPLPIALSEVIARRVDGQVFHRIMAASLRPSGLEGIEDNEIRNDLAEAGRELEFNLQSPGRACGGMLSLVARYIQLAGCVVVVGVSFSWLAAAGLLAATMLFRYGQRGGLRKLALVFPPLAERRRRTQYFADVSTGAEAAKEIRVFGLVDWLAGRYREAYRSWMVPLWTERRRIYLASYLWMTLFALLLVAAVLVSLGAGADELSLTTFALVAQSILIAVRLGDFYPEADVQTEFGMYAYTALRSLELKMAAYDQEPRPTGQQMPARAGTIRFDNVSFRYPGQDRLVIDGLDLAIPEGLCTAIVGLNGSGKTTLVKLLAGLYQPAAGTITVDGVDIATIPPDAWRRQLSIIFQDYLCYETSAADNIAFGSVEHLDDAAGVMVAARMAGIADTLTAMPLGLRTPLARHLPGGMGLSGGQWQRVAIARALFALRHDASVLVLDEPTASLDVRAEARFYDDVVRSTRGITTVLISHRFSTVQNADNIVVLENGRVCEQGSSTELLALGGRYATLFSLQASRFLDGFVPSEHDEVDALPEESR